ncbi:bifunctional diaminohydroxyphosphoribosylaminopyrimidine deaminase/5-amino-6-(5-phosphoribosylamino)uracil reductase RibD [Flavicella sp.]|uniref:bifunctional diaminohydroxyphosphoribosylaminopyrimidine deaminase/5-amino-6-(5-phosphoribosylamino)uracil reductase RibD n=1 Tax=Flavicella sp. TaxID=2957742 RepID=UPI0030189312
MELDEFYMTRCLQLAQNGIGEARPNPSVGCVIVFEGSIIGEGYTSPYGRNHAEVNAISSVKEESLLKKATLYVTLEPCAHFGKTPPCADLIVKYKIPKVVVGCVDTHSVVAGKGIERLRVNGCEVKLGVLEEQCLEQHKRFFTVQNKNRPYVILKWAQSKDGFVAPLKKEENRPVWISNAYAQQIVHKWRSKEHAILVGTNTAIADNPKLNVRYWGGQSPVRIVLDKTLRIPASNSLFDGSVKTIVCTNVSVLSNAKSKNNLVFEGMNFSGNIVSELCRVLIKHQIQSVIIEGGSQTLQTFIKAGLWDEARVFYGDVVFEGGVRAPCFSEVKIEEVDLKGTKLKIFKNRSHQGYYGDC